jgi:hypothetical protein
MEMVIFDRNAASGNFPRLNNGRIIFKHVLAEPALHGGDEIFCRMGGGDKGDINRKRNNQQSQDQ